MKRGERAIINMMEAIGRVYIVQYGIARIPIIEVAVIEDLLYLVW